MSADNDAGKPELFALMSSGTYHRQSCSYAKDADNLVTFDQIPAGSKPCGRCDPPPVSAPPPPADTPPPPEPPKVNDTSGSGNGTDRPEEKKRIVRAECVKACTAQGGFRKPGDILSFEEGRVNPHFRVIGG